MDLQPLIEELAKPEYAGLSDQEAADAVNAKTVSARVPVDTWQIKQYAVEQGVWAKLKVAIRSGDTPAEVYGLCSSIVDWIDDPSGKIGRVDIDLPSVQTMLSALVQAGLATQDQIDTIKAMADQTLRWVDVNGIGTIGIGYVRNARGA